MASGGLFSFWVPLNKWLLIYGHDVSPVTPPHGLYPSAALRPSATLYPSSDL